MSKEYVDIYMKGLSGALSIPELVHHMSNVNTANIPSHVGDTLNKEMDKKQMGTT